MKQLFLHIGCPKTGSTSIQSMYGNNPHLLHDAGYAFPPFTQMPESSELRCFKTNGQSFTKEREAMAVERFLSVQSLRRVDSRKFCH